MTSAVVLALVAALVSAGAPPPPRAAGAPVLRLRRTIPLPGNEGWDGLTMDSAGHRLYITRQSRVVVLDVESERIVGEIAGTPGVHGVALAAEFDRGFTSNGDADTVTVFDMKTLATTGTVAVGKGPEAIVYDSPSKRALAFAGEGQDVTAIDAAQGRALGSVALGGRPKAAVADGRGRLFVTLADKNELVALDPVALAVTARWPVSPCETPTGLAVDPRKRRLFVGCQNRLMAVVDADSGKVTATLPIGRGPAATAFDEARGLVFASTPDGALTVAKEDEAVGFVVVENTLTRPGSRTLALDPRSRRLYVPACRFGASPLPTKEQPHPPAPMVPGTLTILVFAR